uniref:Putative triabin-like lipocalin n=1 Tax=Rhipicephalus microplus TaxID=6941 RepID=A0A6M2CMX3_RHIMP
MKIIFSLTFVAILALASAATVPDESGCQSVVGKETYEPNKYFHGKWYLTHAQKTPSSPTDVCRESKNEVLEDGSVIHNIYAYSDKATQQFYLLECTTNLKDVKDGTSVLNCKSTKDGKVNEFQLTATVLETDYEHFTVLYVCGKLEGKNYGNFLVLNRDKNGEPTDPKIAETLKKHGLDLSTFTSRKNVHCKDHPSTVSN